MRGGCSAKNDAWQKTASKSSYMTKKKSLFQAETEMKTRLSTSVSQNKLCRLHSTRDVDRNEKVEQGIQLCSFRIKVQNHE